jgi:hypothetical protein
MKITRAYGTGSGESLGDPRDQRIAELEAALWKFAEFGRWFDSLEESTPIPLPHVPESRPNDLTAGDFSSALDLLLQEKKL